MESFDVSYGGKNGVLYIADEIRLELEGNNISTTPLACMTYGNERIVLVWEEDDQRQSILLRILSAPAAQVTQAISRMHH